jgi:hypothetical protein
MQLLVLHAMTVQHECAYAVLLLAAVAEADVL